MVGWVSMETIELDEVVYANPLKPTEDELLLKRALGFRLRFWEEMTVHRVFWRRKLFEESPNCTYCKKELQWDRTTLDHKVPASRGGFNAPCNYCIACEACNRRKGHLTQEEFAEQPWGVGKSPQEQQKRLNKKLKKALDYQVLWFRMAPLC